MADELSLLGIYYSVMSLVLVYQIFLLQTWASDVDGTDGDVERMLRYSVKGDHAWSDALDDCNSLKKSFPSWIVSAISGVILLLSVLSLYLATFVDFSLLLTVTPIVAFGALGLLLPIYIRRTWNTKLDERIKQLS